LWEFLLSELDNNIIESIINSNEIDARMIEGFNNFAKSFKKFLKLFDFTITNNNGIIKVFKSFTLNNGSILRATNNYHGQAWFSDVSVNMDMENSSQFLTDENLCYGQVCYV
jgi:hypothetical protein